MTTKTVIHKCNKETEIAVMKTQQEHITEKLEAIHDSVTELNHKLLGNGKPGIIAEQNHRITELEKKLIYYAGAVAVIVFLITIFAPRIVNALAGG